MMSRIVFVNMALMPRKPFFAQFEPCAMMDHVTWIGWNNIWDALPRWWMFMNKTLTLSGMDLQEDCSAAMMM